jgi:hypothetical protein
VILGISASAAYEPVPRSGDKLADDRSGRAGPVSSSGVWQAGEAQEPRSAAA